MTVSKAALSEQRRTAQICVGFAFAAHFYLHARGSLAHWLCISKRLKMACQKRQVPGCLKRAVVHRF
jgi:hypothetical protein